MFQNLRSIKLFMLVFALGAATVFAACSSDDPETVVQTVIVVATPTPGGSGAAAATATTAPVDPSDLADLRFMRTGMREVGIVRSLCLTPSTVTRILRGR